MQREASFVIRNARVLTMDAANPRASAVAIAGNRILAVGSEAEIDAFSGPDTHVIDARGGTVLPGFNEAHMHIFGGSPNSANCRSPASRGSTRWRRP